ncbi:hypothetical protein [Bradyrhizobium genomosp. III]|uniref:hypothetical protein n=1 Tax=Bradyrhizobium genomosp. III TaxID=2683271 RepID=UPI0004AD3D3C|nr:hypothetical protein [Bradyrhizobium sp. CCBAU 15635]
MNAPVKILDAQTLEDAIGLLETRALIRAYLEYEYQFEHLADAIDPLQESAEASGLVAAIGQDRVQEIIAKPFARFRDIVAAEIEAELMAQLEPDLPDDYALCLVREWELSDERDRWKWTGEMPPVRAPAPTERPTYRTPQATVDAFLFVLGTGDVERLSAWLARHPADAPHLLRIYEGQNANRA